MRVVLDTNIIVSAIIAPAGRRTVCVDSSAARSARKWVYM